MHNGSYNILRFRFFNRGTCMSINKLLTSNSLTLNPLIFRFLKKKIYNKVGESLENEKNPLRKLHRIVSNIK